MLIIINVVLEMTRNCNFLCAHCLKGESYDKDLNLEILPKIFNKNVIIQNLQFTGGEVFLKPELFSKTIDFIINSGVNVSHLNIITNGTCYNKEIENSLKKINLYIQKCQLLSLKRMKCIDIELSTDEYHQKEMLKIKNKDFSLYTKYMNNIKKLINSDFFSDYRDNEKIINEGRAKNLNIEKYEPYQNNLYYFENKLIGFDILQASGINIDVNGYIKKTKDGNLLENDLLSIIKNNGIKCINEEEFVRNYNQNINNMINMQLIKK